MPANVCSLIAGKSDNESIEICLECPLDECRGATQTSSPKKEQPTGPAAAAGIPARSQPFKVIYRPPVKPMVIVKPVAAVKSPADKRFYPPDRAKPADFFPASCFECQKHKLLPQNCLHPEWFSPSDIRLCPEQSIWLLTNLRDLREGHWPSAPSSYTDPGVSNHHARAKANFETALQWSAEITRRLEACRFDGLITLMIYAFESPEESMAKYVNTDVYEVRRRVNAVINYISRWNMKKPYRRQHWTERPVNHPDALSVAASAIEPSKETAAVA